MTNLSYARLLVSASVLLAGLIYWQGVAGPYLFDDFWNLAPIEKWAAGSVSWRQALLPNPNSIVDSRPVAMASFMLTTWLSGPGAIPLKVGNLLMHALCGAAGWLVMRHAFRCDPKLKAAATMLASIGTAVWLLHPIHVSTVLYAVQRMTQLSAFFTLLAVLAYLVGREAADRGVGRRSLPLLFLAFPLLWGLGVLSKQNAIVAPFLCLVLEVAYFRGPAAKRRGAQVFFVAFALIPSILAVILLALRPDIVTAGYVDWDFTLAQRILTQPRVLMSYIGALLIPYAPAMGLYTDDYVLSNGLLDPVTTLLAILALLGISYAAIKLKTRAPSFFAGWFFFLVAHSLEAGPLPLEMYYEHRNYLPSFGLIIAVLSLGTVLYEAFARRATNPELILRTGCLLLLAALSTATLGRALLWQENRAIVEQGVTHHPASLHAAMDAVAIAVDDSDYRRAIEILEPQTRSESARVRMVARLYVASIQCVRGPRLDPTILDEVVADALPRLTVYDVQMMKSLEKATQQPACRGKVEGRVADTYAALLSAAVLQPESGPNKTVPRDLTARLYTRAGNWSSAEAQARQAWRAGFNPPTGALLARIYLHTGQVGEAKAVIGQLSTRIDPRDLGGQAELTKLRELAGEAEDKRPRPSLPP